MKTSAKKEIDIPFPPKFSLSAGLNQFVPEDGFHNFFAKTFFDEKHFLFNPEHLHLMHAHIGFLWTNVLNKKGGRIIAGTAEIPFFRGGKWQNARQELQMEKWFGRLPDFVITINAVIFEEMADAEKLALIEHELYHCGQAKDEWGMPKFRKSDNRPVFSIVGHDFEEFTGVVRRYGIAATGQNGVDMMEAAAAKPLIAAADIKRMCGSC